MSTGESLTSGILVPYPREERVLDGARLFLDRGFTQLDSVFTPGQAVWDRATVDELYRLFVEHPDEGSRDFLTKLRDQIGSASDAVKQLAAELLTLNRLPVSDLARERKQQLVGTILTWCSTPVSIPAEISDVFGDGSFDGGIAFKIHVPAHLRDLVTMLRRWHALVSQERQRALDDPWAWKRFVMDSPGQAALAQRNALLYLAHPQTFLPIISQDHKKRIRDAFHDYLEAPTKDLDRDLLQITLALQAETHGPVEYYQPPLYEQWAVGRRPSGKRAWFVRGSSVDGHNLVHTWLAEGWVSLAASQLREVEPGTGRRALKEIIDADYQHKSYAARETKLQEFDAFLNQMKADDLVVTTTGGKVYLGTVSSAPEFTDSAGARSNLRRRVEWRNPDRPADFAKLPPPLPAKFGGQADVIDLTEELALLESLLVPVAPIPQKAHLPNATEELAARLFFDRVWLQELIELLRDRQQVILYGPPGTGKTYVAQHVARHLTQAEPSAVKLVQFHPSYSYEDFFEGYRPAQGDGGALAFELRPGPFRRVVEAARQDSTTPYILIIDEINRANVAKVFGELYFLLEYRDESIGLQYSAAEDEFTLPQNVFLIGTMNTADRSIALVDTALRRRFAFVSLHPSQRPVRGLLRRWLDHNGLPDEAARLLDALNQRVADRDYAIGPSYFMRPEIYERENGLERVWRTEIMPLVEELYYGEGGIENRYGLDALRKAVAAHQGEP